MFKKIFRNELGDKVKKKFYAVYFTLLTDQEVKEVIEYDLMDDDKKKFEEFCLKSKNRELLGIFPYEYQTVDFIESLDVNSGIVKVSGRVFVVRQIEINVDRSSL